MLTWHYITRSKYDSMKESEKTMDKLFYIKYENRLYNGPELFKEYIIIYNSQPGTSVTDRVYINKNDLYGMIWDGDNWSDLINPIRKVGEATVNPSDIKSVQYNSTYNNLTVTFVDDTTDTIEFSDLFIDVRFNAAGVPGISDTWCYLSSDKQVNLTSLIKKISYSSNTSTLTFMFDTLGSNKWDVPFDDLLFKRINANVVTITGNSFIAECAGYYNEKSEISKTPKDIYAVYRVDAGSDTMTAMDMVNFAIKNILAVAMELTDTMFTVGFGHTDEVLLADDIGNAKASGVELSTAFSPVPDNYHLPTEKAIYDFLDENLIEAKDVTNSEHFARLTMKTASEKKVPSEKALVAKMTWKVI